jgi:hypothetical protein
MSAHGPLAAGSSTSVQSRRTKVRVLVGLVSAVLTPLLLTACRSGDSTAPNTTSSVVWSTVPSGITQNLSSVWGTSASDVWAVGDEMILHYNGVTWSFSSTSFADLRGVWGSSSSDVWAVGILPTGDFMGGAILHYNGKSWSTVSNVPSQALFGVWGSSASDVWAVGSGYTILHYDGTNWSSVSSGTTWPLPGIWGSSSSNVWAVGCCGTIVHGSPAG